MSNIKCEDNWLKRNQLFNEHLSPEIKCWLFDTTSLTARVKKICSGKFSVLLLSQKILKPLNSEQKALGIKYGGYGLIRQVRLYCDTTPLVYARTVIPVTFINKELRKYTNLGTKPLGEVLFADRTMQREEVMFTRLTPSSELYTNTYDEHENIRQDIWGRRSVFRVNGKPLLVSEYFLPSLIKLTAPV